MPKLHDFYAPEEINALRHLVRTLERRDKVTLSRSDRETLLAVLPELINAWDNEAESTVG